MSWLVSFLRWERNVLGEIEPFSVAFPDVVQTVDQLSEIEITVPLSRSAIGGLGVSVNNTYWDWKYQDEFGEWRDLITTRHRVYCVVRHPTLPWQEDFMGGANPNLPWTDALDLACEWAAGARSADAAASAIVGGVWTATLRYDVEGFASDNVTGTFNLTEFIRHLRAGTSIHTVDCTDCAAAVSTFANILGGDFDQHQFTNVETSRAVKLIGHSETGPITWTLHEFASRPGGPTLSTRVIWDACLQLNAATSPAPFMPEPVQGMPFARYKNLFFGADRGLTVEMGRRHVV
jgi:hypothetical protein